MRTQVILILAWALVPAHSAVEAQEGKKTRLRVSIPVEGVVQEVTVKVGDRVQRGDVLARLDDRLAKLEVEIAQTMVQGAEVELQMGDALLKESEARLQRARAAVDRRVISQEEFLEKDMQVRKAKSN